MDLQPSVYLSIQYYRAFEYANQWHRDQARKSTTLPYILHPMGVASLVLEAGGDEEQAIAALLHDVPEDCGGEVRLVEILEMFGPRVEAMVRGCSDSLVAEREEKAPWRERKQAHIDHVATAHMDTLIVTAADKTHNGRAIATDLQTIGDEVWDRFNASRDDIIWYYSTFYSELEKRGVTKALLNPLLTAIEIMKIER
ncbi:HD domain containing protein [Candidatus Nanopelagicaceae bacterium]